MTTGMDSRMYLEAAQAPKVVRGQLENNADISRRIGALLREMNPRAVVTCARGSSDHAATFAKYLIESHTKLLTTSAAPSLSSLYDAQPDMRGVVFLVISQSGKSPDLLASAENAKRNGACVIALCNTPDSPLTQLADHSLPLHAGPETSVAATKSYIASLSAIVHLVACWTTDQTLLGSLMRAPEQLAQAWDLDWRAALPVLQQANNLFVLGRGYGLGVAQEAALKFKETCGLHAEAFSTAEVKHGPMALVGRGFPVLMLSQNDESRAGIEKLATEFVQRGADVLLAGPKVPDAIALPTIASHAVIEPLLMVQSFYRMVASLAPARGLDPDRPPHLNKVTETL
ncbi:SIS domain-containing protein [Steroidobacter sp. S1-65]|uniref:SIS domain-containing protein n=1 Tax=Steroidobacter gossypii TaxID=2805490 RepID=A0ABS1X214_9GAMM|nr:SIS domain-containing protein [Steroidobacter gossypii]MBM0107276.1 SIS domain-containing protein [Steroidobacter gossypii]